MKKSRPAQRNISVISATNETEAQKSQVWATLGNSETLIQNKQEGLGIQLDGRVLDHHLKSPKFNQGTTVKVLQKQSPTKLLCLFHHLRTAKLQNS